MKAQRHAKIVELIKKNNVETQEELTAKLKECGFDTTQATVSRDIKELKLVKVPDDNGKYKYDVKLGDDEIRVSAKFKTILEETVLRIDVSTSIVVIKTFPGMAQAAASAIDNMNWSEIVGTIAGDDTIFVALRTCEDAILLCQKVKELLNI
ncbi:MAG: arginine repressor [Ruminococcaceae bacterium]|nr:arginine repressor [Oscillospiraceae bacterium]